MDEAALRHRFAAAPIARLATADVWGRPLVVPVCFALDGDTVHMAVDDKPKRTTRLKRLENVAANPSASLLVDHYDEDWARLWWVRADGNGRLVDDDEGRARAVSALRSKYEQYRDHRLDGPVLVVDVIRWVSWEATPGSVKS